jgi:LPS sulfotransferase NodH
LDASQHAVKSFALEIVMKRSIKIREQGENIFPAQDFAHQKFDRDSSSETKELIVIFSTQRSGSTLLCDLLYRNDFCLAHEYFQLHEYLPALSRRWGCVDDNGNLIIEKYASELMKNRTLSNGKLGINLHGRHIELYKKIEPLWVDIPKRYIHLRRDDIIAQAISYEIAKQSKKWSSHFKVENKAEYSFEGILDKSIKIQRQNQLIDQFLRAKNEPVIQVDYGDLIASPENALFRIDRGIDMSGVGLGEGLTKQSGELNAKWKYRFTNDFIRYEYERRYSGRWFKKIIRS